MPMGCAYAQIQEFHAVELEGFGHGAAGSGASGGLEHDGAAFHQPQRMFACGRVGASGRRVAVVALHVFPVAAGAPPARVAAKPCAVGGAGAKQPIVPWKHGPVI